MVEVFHLHWTISKNLQTEKTFGGAAFQNVSYTKSALWCCASHSTLWVWSLTHLCSFLASQLLPPGYPQNLIVCCLPGLCSELTGTRTCPLLLWLLDHVRWKKQMIQWSCELTWFLTLCPWIDFCSITTLCVFISCSLQPDFIKLRLRPSQISYASGLGIFYSLAYRAVKAKWT